MFVYLNHYKDQIMAKFVQQYSEFNVVSWMYVTVDKPYYSCFFFKFKM